MLKFEISKKGNEKIKITGKSYEISRLVSDFLRLSQGQKPKEVKLETEFDSKAIYEGFRDLLAKCSDLTKRIIVQADE